MFSQLLEALTQAFNALYKLNSIFGRKATLPFLKSKLYAKSACIEPCIGYFCTNTLHTIRTSLFKGLIPPTSFVLHLETMLSSFASKTSNQAKHVSFWNLSWYKSQNLFLISRYTIGKWTHKCYYPETASNIPKLKTCSRIPLTYSFEPKLLISISTREFWKLITQTPSINHTKAI